MSKIKVLHILWSASMGGIARVVLNLCNTQLNNSNLIPALLVAKSDGELIEQFKSIGIDVYEPGFKNGKDRNEETLSICLKAFMHCDIIHFHSFNPIIANLAAKSKKKIVYTEHGNFAFGRHMTIKDLIVQYLEKRFLNKHVNFITFNSEFTKSVSLKRFGLKKVNSAVIYNGVSQLTEKYLNPNNLSSQNKELIILSIGRLAIVKRIDRLINAYSKTDKEGTRLIIVGDGPLKKDLIKIANECGILNKTDFTGTADSSEMIQISDICVFPSQNEAFGLVAIEAYQQGKPVIVFNDGGGLAELVRQIEPELIVNSISNLTILLNNIKTNIHSLQTLEKKQLRKKFASQFSIEKMELNMFKLYQQNMNVRD